MNKCKPGEPVRIDLPEDIRPVAVLDPTNDDQIDQFCETAWGGATKWAMESEDTRVRFRAAIRAALVAQVSA